MASGNRQKYPDKRAWPGESDQPSTWEELLAAERERTDRRAPQPDQEPGDGQEGVTR